MVSSVTDRLDGSVTFAGVKNPCRVATTANITLSGLQTVDGISLMADDRVLVKDQTDSVDNGIWVVSSSTWQRSRDFDGSRDVLRGTKVFVWDGSVNEATNWIVTSDDPITVGSSELDFEEDTSIVAAIAIGDVTGLQAALDAKAALSGPTFTGRIDFTGTGHAGIKLNSLTTAQRDALSAAAGMTIYNSTTGHIEGYQGGTWTNLGAAAASGDMIGSNNLSDLTNTTTARTNLGVAIGTNVQAYDADLAALAGVTSAADKVPYFTGSGTATVADFTAYGRSVVAVASEAAFKALVNLEIGTDVQAWDADLDTWAGKTAPSGTVVGHTDSQTLTNKTIVASSNTISNIATTMFAANVIDTDATLAADSDTRLATQKAVKAYVTANTATNVKASCRVATTTAGTLATSFENGDTVDGVVLATNDRILIKDQADQTTNGIYIVQGAGAPTRSTDMDADAEVPLASVLITAGTANANTTWRCQQTAVTIGATNITFAQTGSATSYTAGTGISLAGNVIAIDSTVATLTGSQTLTNKTIAGGSNTISGITEAMLSTSDLTTLDVSTSKHGFVPKAPNNAKQFLDGTGAWDQPDYDDLSDVTVTTTTRNTDVAVNERVFAMAAADFMRITQTSTTGHAFSPTLRVERTANYSGGEAGWVNACIRATSTVSATATSFEWAIVGVCDNTNATGENVGVYGQCLGRLAGHKSWGMVAEARDFSGSSTNCWGMEIDIFSNSSFVANNLVGCFIVGGKATDAGATPLIYTGLLIDSQGNSNTSANWQNGILIGDYNQRGASAPLACNNGINIFITTSTGNVIWDRSTAANGSAMTGTYTGGAFAMNAGSHIVYDNDAGALVKTRWDGVYIENSRPLQVTGGGAAGRAILEASAATSFQYGIDFGSGNNFSSGMVLRSGRINLQNDGVIDHLGNQSVQPTAGSFAGYYVVKVQGSSYKVQLLNV